MIIDVYSRGYLVGNEDEIVFFGIFVVFILDCILGLGDCGGDSRLYGVWSDLVLVDLEWSF